MLLIIPSIIFEGITFAQIILAEIIQTIIFFSSFFGLVVLLGKYYLKESPVKAELVRHIVIIEIINLFIFFSFFFLIFYLAIGIIIFLLSCFIMPGLAIYLRAYNNPIYKNTEKKKQVWVLYLMVFLPSVLISLSLTLGILRLAGIPAVFIFQF
ncbi:MAG: hypothetical protein ACFFCS_22360 [Candidatus Hodarchaeota archaeon]